MELNLSYFIKTILVDRFNGNQRKCALVLGVSPSFLNRILKRKTKAGNLFLGKLRAFCLNNNLSFDLYIFLT